jgi:hypothetical protein
MSADTEPMVPEEVWRRLRKLEDAVENGRFIRRDIFDLVVSDFRTEIARSNEALGEMRSEMKAEREDRENERKAFRNLLIGTLLAAASSLGVSLLVGLANR